MNLEHTGEQTPNSTLSIETINRLLRAIEDLLALRAELVQVDGQNALLRSTAAACVGLCRGLSDLLRRQPGHEELTSLAQHVETLDDVPCLMLVMSPRTSEDGTFHIDNYVSCALDDAEAGRIQLQLLKNVGELLCVMPPREMQPHMRGLQVLLGADPAEENVATIRRQLQDTEMWDVFRFMLVRLMLDTRVVFELLDLTWRDYSNLRRMSSTTAAAWLLNPRLDVEAVKQVAAACMLKVAANPESIAEIRDQFFVEAAHALNITQSKRVPVTADSTESTAVPTTILNNIPTQ